MGYKVFDAHADTISKLYENCQSIKRNNCHIDLERMKKFDGYIQVFAAFIDKKTIKETPKEYAKKLIEKYKRETDSCDIFHIQTAKDLERTSVSSILSIEGGEAIEGNLDNLYEFFDLGVRIMTLTWNYDNEISGGIGANREGLTSFGKSALKEMNKLGMAVDVSHISEKGFWDVFDISEKPFIASHSNVKKLCGHPRNLSDEQIRAIIERDGVIGINFYPLFLDDSGKCTMEKILEHVEYILEMGGENNIGIGSDFDGIEYLPQGMTGLESMEKLIYLMEKRNYGKEIINKLLFNNFSRVLGSIFA